MHGLLDDGHQRVGFARGTPTILGHVGRGGGFNDVHAPRSHGRPQGVEGRDLLMLLVAPVVDDDIKTIVAGGRIFDYLGGVGCGIQCACSVHLSNNNIPWTETRHPLDRRHTPCHPVMLLY